MDVCVLCRCKEPDMLPLFAELLIDILIDHLQLYKSALSQTNSGELSAISNSSSYSYSHSHSLVSFSLPLKHVEKGVEKYFCENSDDGWGIICSDKEAELSSWNDCFCAKRLT